MDIYIYIYMYRRGGHSGPADKGPGGPTRARPTRARPTRAQGPTRAFCICSPTALSFCSALKLLNQ